MKIIKNNGRYIIIDNNNKIINNANGYGFKSYESANKALWFMNNKNNLINESKLIKDWWDKHKNIYDNICDDIFFESDKCRLNLSKEELIDIYNKYDFSDAPFDCYKMVEKHDFAYKLIKK